MVRCSNHSTGPVCQPILEDATSPELRLFYPTRTTLSGRLPPQVANNPDFGFYRYNSRTHVHVIDILFGEWSRPYILIKGLQTQIDRHGAFG